jgi:hypothetical protein
MKQKICVLLAVLGLGSSLVMAEPDCYKFKNAQARENCFKNHSNNKYDKYGDRNNDRDYRDKKDYYRDNDFKRYDKRYLDCDRFESSDVRRDCRKYKYGGDNYNYQRADSPHERECRKTADSKEAFERCMRAPSRY